MPKALNPALPAGTRGLWWFRQETRELSLRNLGTALTGPAVLSGSTWFQDPGVVHNDPSHRTILSPDANLLIPSNAITIMFGLRWTDTTLRGCGTFGVEPEANQNTRAGMHFPYSDNIAYWDWGGYGSGNRLQTAAGAWGAKDTTTLNVWAVTVGARGMEIWKNGTKIASNANQPTTVAATSLDNYVIGFHGGGTGDLGVWPWFFIHQTQLSEALIQTISANPETTLTQEAPLPTSGTPIAWTPLGRGRLVRSKLVGGWTPIARIAPEGPRGPAGPQGVRSSTPGFPLVPPKKMPPVSTWTLEGGRDPFYGTIRDEPATGTTYMHAPGISSGWFRCIAYIALPAPTGVRTITGAFTPLIWGSNNAGMGLALGLAASNKWLIWSAVTPSGLITYRYDTYVDSAYVSRLGGFARGTGVIYLRLIIDATNIIYQYSADGVFFTTLATEGKAEWLTSEPNRVGLYARGIAWPVAGRWFHWDVA